MTASSPQLEFGAIELLFWVGACFTADSLLVYITAFRLILVHFRVWLTQPMAGYRDECLTYNPAFLTSVGFTVTFPYI